MAVLDKLEVLNISSNLLLSLPDLIGTLDRMKVLNTSGNKLSTLPDSISYCRYSFFFFYCSHATFAKERVEKRSRFRYEISHFFAAVVVFSAPLGAKEW